WFEHVEDDGTLVWHELGKAQGRTKLNVRRAAFSCAGPGLRELLAPHVGWALLEAQREGVPVTVPVRVELVDGLGAPAVAARDARVAGEREARRRSPEA